MNHQLETFERVQPLARMTSALPAATYNLSRILLAASPTGCVFVPLRGMQYLAVVDREEIIFVDSQYKRWVEVAWQGFRPRSRSSLEEPVAYQALFYTEDGPVTQRRVQVELHGALALLAARRPLVSPAHVLNLPQPSGLLDLGRR